jgi:hypothetical protein
MDRHQDGMKMDMTSRYRINRPQVITEMIDGEAVIIHQGTGAYYSIAATGGALWAGIEVESPVSELVALLEARCEGGSRSEIETGVERLIEELRVEDLIVESNGDRTGEENPLVEGPPLGPFEPPALRKYTDMQDLILIDPVHEVDERGWPYATPGSPAGDGA